MASSDVVARTKELIQVLDSLTTTSNITAESVAALENVVNRLSSLSADASIRSIVTLLNQFNAGLAALEGHPDKINKVTAAFQGLATAVKQQSSSYEMAGYYSKAGVATKKAGAAMASGDVYEARKQEALASQYKTLAANIKKEVAGTIPILRETFDLASEAQMLQQSIMQRLIPPSVPLLPAVTETSLNSQRAAAEREAYYANSRRERMQRLTSQVETPAERMRRLTAGISTGPPPPQAPGTIVSGVTGPTTPYTALVQQGVPAAQAQAAVTPVASLVQQSVQQGAQAGLAAGLQAGAAAGAQAVGAGVQAGVQQGAQVGVQQGTQTGAQQGAPQVQQVVQTATQQGAQAGTAAGTVAGAQQGGAGLTPGQAGPQPTLAQLAAQATTQAPATLNQALFQSMGLSNQAASALEKKLQSLNLTQGTLSRSTTELSTGIQTITFSAFDPLTQATKTFTAHLGPMGNLLEDTQKRFRSFGSAIMRDVVEVLKWTIAITAIYTPIRKLGEMLEEMKKIQLDMVDVQIVLGNSTRDLNTVFEASSRIATETSSSLEGVIEGYALAAAASASAENETQRMITTESLLKNSMTLSKIANIDQKQALDTLVGSLSQLGMKLTDGTALLDSWVAVSKKANVSVKDMSTSFTIVGAAAEEAGLSYHELNALIGTLAQSTNLSADELGNAIRGIIAAMQTDKAQAEFAKYGIATKTVAGDFRDFMEILKEMKVMSQTGILDEKAMGALTQAGGAGARRGAQLSALVQGLATAMNLITVSENANGDAAKAMALEMETLDAATTRLNNAFTSLAVSLGGEGGVLGALTFVTNAVTFLITQVKGLVSIMRIAAPMMATFMLTKGVLGTKVGVGLMGTQIPMWLSQLFTSANFAGQTQATATAPSVPLAGRQPSGLLAGLTRRLQGTNIGSTVTQTTQGGIIPLAVPIGRRANIGEFAGGIGTRLASPFLGQMSMANVGAPALYSILSSLGRPKEEGIPRAAIGGITGVLTAALTGSTMWATIGAIIATGFYDKFLTFQGDIATGWSQFLATNPPKKPGDENKPPEDIMADMEALIKPSLSTGEIFASNLVAFGNNLLSSIGIGRTSNQQVSQLLTGEPGTGKQAVSQGDVLLLMAKGLIGGASVMDEETRKQVIDLYNRWLVEQTQQGLMGDIPMTTAQTAIEAEVAEVSKYAATASVELMNEALDAVATGAAGSVQNYIDSQNIAEGLASTAASLIVAQTALGQPVPGMEEYTPLPGYQPMNEQQAVNFVAGLNPEQQSAVTSAYTEILDALNGIETVNSLIAAQPGGATEDQKKMLASYRAELERISKTFPQILNAIQSASIVTNATDKLKDVISLPEMTPEQLQRVRAAADKMWREYLKASGLTDAEITAYINAESEKLLKIGESFPGISVKPPSEFWTAAAAQEGVGQNTSIQELDVSIAQLNQALAQYPQFLSALQAAIYKMSGGTQTYTENAMDYLFLTNDNNAKTAHVDQTILQLLMRDLIDIEEKKGLQGMYNLPEGATFYVPVTAYEMSKATVTEMAGGGSSGILQSIFDLLQQYLPEAVKPTTEVNEGAQLQRNRMIAREEALAAAENKPTTPPVTPPPYAYPSKSVAEDIYMMNGLPPLEPPLTTVESFQQPIPPPVMPETLTPLQKFFQDLLQWLPLRNLPEPATPSYPPAQGSTVPTTPPETLTPLQKFFQDLLQWLPLTNLPAPVTTTVEPQTSVVPEIPTVVAQLPPSMLNWFSNQSMITSPALATTVTQQTTQPPINTALNLSVDSNIVLTVDGRTLATIIKPYLYEDLLRFNATTSSTNRSVIA